LRNINTDFHCVSNKLVYFLIFATLINWSNIPKVKNAAAYQVKRSAVKKIQNLNKGIAKARQQRPMLTASLLLRRQKTSKNTKIKAKS